MHASMTTRHITAVKLITTLISGVWYFIFHRKNSFERYIERESQWRKSLLGPTQQKEGTNEPVFHRWDAEKSSPTIHTLSDPRIRNDPHVSSNKNLALQNFSFLQNYVSGGAGMLTRPKITLDDFFGSHLSPPDIITHQIPVPSTPTFHHLPLLDSIWGHRRRIWLPHIHTTATISSPSSGLTTKMESFQAERWSGHTSSALRDSTLLTLFLLSFRSPMIQISSSTYTCYVLRLRQLSEYATCSCSKEGL